MLHSCGMIYQHISPVQYPSQPLNMPFSPIYMSANPINNFTMFPHLTVLSPSIFFTACNELTTSLSYHSFNRNYYCTMSSFNYLGSTFYRHCLQCTQLNCTWVKHMNMYMNSRLRTVTFSLANGTALDRFGRPTWGGIPFRMERF